MNFNRHTRLEGAHAFLSASRYHWVNYDDNKLDASFLRHFATQKGIELHDFARRAIDLGIKLPKSNKSLNLYVNDAIGFRMKTEQILFYSFNCFGTADTIMFRKKMLRIHDLKTGLNPASMKQLEVYTSLFCLEYEHKPEDIETELRIYQKDQVIVHNPDPEEINRIMNKIIAFDKRIEELKAEGYQ